MLSEWARQTSLPTGWLSLDKRDNNPSRFWAYFTAALRTIPGLAELGIIGATLQNPLTVQQLPPIEELLVELVNEIAALPGRYLLVLDDLHVISEATIHDGLLFLLDYMPTADHGLHLVVSSRSDPPWPLARARVRGDLAELREHDLRFTIDEVTAYLNQAMTLTLSSEDIENLDQRTEGWIAGLQMAAISMLNSRQELGEDGISKFIARFSGGHHFVLDFLVEEVLDRQLADVQAFLLKTAILERMSAPLVEAVTGIDDGQAALALLEKRNLFLLPLDDNRQWFRYHHLFADLLRRKLEQEEPDLALELHEKASVWFEKTDLVDEAVMHALAANDEDRAASLAERHGMALIARSELVTLQGWLKALPQSEISRRPWLCVYHAWVTYYAGPREQTETHLTKAELAMQASGELETVSGQGEMRHIPESEGRKIKGHVAALRAYLALQNGELDLVAQQAQRALKNLPDGDYAKATSAIALAETYRASGDLTGWYEAYREAKAIALICDNRPMAVSAATYMADLLAKQGRLHEAHQGYLKAVRLAVDRDGKQIAAAGLPYVKLGDLMREWHKFPAAHEYLSKGISRCLQWGHSDSLVIGYIAQSRAALAVGDRREVIEAFQRAERLVRRTAIDP